MSQPLAGIRVVDFPQVLAGLTCGRVLAEEFGQAVTGIQSLWASSAGDRAKFTFPITDIATGHLAAFDVLLALFHRNSAGQGQAVSWAAPVVMWSDASNTSLVRGFRHPPRPANRKWMGNR
jgi:crotonobetainyl-CoA:carnitine CoA-transferase CaiB-like acyl-CoA transferase